MKISNFQAVICGLGINLVGAGLKKMSFDIPAYIFFIFGTLLIVSVPVFNYSRRQKKNISTPAPLKQTRIPKNVPEDQENILKFLATLSPNERLHADDIAEDLHLSPQKTQLLLDQLEQVGLVDKFANSYIEHPTYSLSEKGRIYLNKKGLL